MKNMKKKGLLLGALSVLCLSSVGFASWVISQGDNKDVNGNISAETVTDNSVKIKSTEWFSDVGLSTSQGATGNIHFGKDGTAEMPKWLTFTDDDNKDKSVLTAYLKVQLEQGHGAKVKEATATFTETTSLITDETCIVKPTSLTPDTTHLATDNYFVVPVEFKWGSLFDNKCPETFFGKESNATDLTTVNKTDIKLPGGSEEKATNAQLANYVLTNVKELSAATFKVTVNITAKTAQDK